MAKNKVSNRAEHLVGFRIQHKVDRMGIFWTKFRDWQHDVVNTPILYGFQNIEVIHQEFGHMAYSRYKCAFKSLQQLLETVTIDQLERLSKYDFEIIRLEGRMVKGKTQFIYRESQVKIENIELSKLSLLLAEDIAKREIIEEFGELIDPNIFKF